MEHGGEELERARQDLEQDGKNLECRRHSMEHCGDTLEHPGSSMEPGGVISFHVRFQIIGTNYIPSSPCVFPPPRQAKGHIYYS